MKPVPYAYFILPPIILLGLFVLMLVMPLGRDWQTWDVTSITQMQTPYSMPDFAGMPFAFFALPHALLNIDIGNAINLALNILVIAAVAEHYDNKSWHIAVAITMTSPMGINLLMSNNIDWIPLSAFLFADWLAYPLLAMKPNVLAGMALIRFKRTPSLFALLPLVVMLMVSIVIWGSWWMQLGDGLSGVAWNFAPFPYMIPVGLYLLWKAWRSEDEIIAACATPFLVPYFAPYSLTGLHVLLAAKYRRAAIWLWFIGWWFVVIAARRG